MMVLSSVPNLGSSERLAGTTAVRTTLPLSLSL